MQGVGVAAGAWVMKAIATVAMAMATRVARRDLGMGFWWGMSEVRGSRVDGVVFRFDSIRFDSSRLDAMGFDTGWFSLYCAGGRSPDVSNG